MIFTDRFAAAKELAKKLQKYKHNKNAVILAIPRGGLQTGYTLAKELNLKLDIILTKKIGYPGNEEYAIGAVSLKSIFINEMHKDISNDYINSEIKKIRKTITERYQKYLGDKKPTNLKDKIVIITDDGVATGSTILAAIDLVKQENPKRIVVAVPVGPANTIRQLKKKADEVICLIVPETFFAIGQFYQEFAHVEDEEAIRLLKEANK